VAYPGTDRALEFTVEFMGVGDELSRGGGTAGRRQATNGVGGQDVLLASPYAIDPWLKCVIVANRDGAGELIVGGGRRETVFTREGGPDAVSKVLAKTALLRAGRIAKRGGKREPRGSAGRQPGRVCNCSVHHGPTAEAIL